MIINSEKINTFFLGLCALFLGIYLEIYTIPMSLVIGLILLLKNIKNIEYKQFLYVNFFIILFLLIEIFYNQYLPANKPSFTTYGFNYFILVSFIFGALLSTLDKNEKLFFIYFLSVGMLFKSLVVILATILILDPPYYSYVYDIFSGDIGSSISYANAMCFFILTFIFSNVNYQNLIGKFLFFISFIGSILLGARLYFFILFISLLYRLKILIILFSIAFLFYGFINFLQLDINLANFSIIKRFSDGGINSGISSGRYYLYYDYFDQLLKNPFDNPIINVYGESWFHSLILDVHRTTNLFVALYLLIIFLLPIFCIRKSQFDSKKNFLFLYLFSLAILFTTVPLDGGDYTSMIYFMAVCLALL